MGVPAFFRWLSRKYPSVVVDAVEEKARDVDGHRIPVRTTEPNPNFQEFDNLYLDMNGIIHPCTHPEDQPPPKNEDEMFALIFDYIDRLFAIVRPRRLLYMAIDGVAPRAKMNQQRSRRFRASQEASLKHEQIFEVRSRLEKEGFPLPPIKSDTENFDSNCITPGTPFMARLADALCYYIHMRLNGDPAWEKIQVILSDANVPGEGEHKIMDYIRRQRALPSHDPNTVHCICGADADLIMLGLATHEPNFNIIREEFLPNQPRPCDLCGQYGHELKDCQGLAKEEVAECHATPLQKEKNFIFVRLPILREYLEKELFIPNSPIPFDLERSIDDWVFMCFFVGNDFLPHLPSLEIRENAIDRLIRLYKDVVYKMRGYLTENGIVHMQRVQLILDGLGKVEDEIFRQRQQNELAYRRRLKEDKRRGRYSAPSSLPIGCPLITPVSNAPAVLSGTQLRTMAYDSRVTAMKNESSAATSKDGSNERKRKQQIDEPESDEEPVDEVRLWEPGWKQRYYETKFEVDGNDLMYRRKVAWDYMEGLCWVLRYYYQGCASWNWYFPYHYAPFASDFDTVSQFKEDFSAATQPFKPLQQLMSVFPAASRYHLPESWQILMIDPESPIIDFYPEDFKVDLNGKKFAWQGVALLPFVDEKRLLETLAQVEDKLDTCEKERNTTGPSRIFVSCLHPVSHFFKHIYEQGTGELLEIDPKLTYGMAGKVGIDPKYIPSGTFYKSPIPLDRCPDLVANTAIMTLWQDPTFEEGYVFSSARLPDAKDVAPTLKPSDFNNANQYRPQIGFSRRVPIARLADAGHRMISHETNFRNDSLGTRSTYDSQINQRNFEKYGGRPSPNNSGRGYISEDGRGRRSYNNRNRYENDSYMNRNDRGVAEIRRVQSYNSIQCNQYEESYNYSYNSSYSEPRESRSGGFGRGFGYRGSDPSINRGRY